MRQQFIEVSVSIETSDHNLEGVSIHHVPIKTFNALKQVGKYYIDKGTEWINSGNITFFKSI